jgi:CRP-like cAMP-binding protein
MQQISQVISSMIQVSQETLDQFLEVCFVNQFPKKAFLSHPDVVPGEIFFINSGIIRVMITDQAGTEHTVHFALENQFIADYSCFMQGVPSHYSLQALEDTEVVVLPRKAIDWGYSNLVEGDKLGRLIAEFYFIYQDDRIKNQYIRSPKERYEAIATVFPNIHNRAPQHMIASYLGISPVHLSRLKKADVKV